MWVHKQSSCKFEPAISVPGDRMLPPNLPLGTQRMDTSAVIAEQTISGIQQSYAAIKNDWPTDHESCKKWE